LAVLLADDFLTYDDRGVTADLVNAFEVSGKTQLSVVEANGSDIFKCGVVIPGGGPGLVSGLLESQMLTKDLQTWRVLGVMY
jgi:UTP--glucose-1-phosphate uridylyltransferase